jgi:hypothetical protein
MASSTSSSDSITDNSEHMQIFYFVTGYPPNNNNRIQPVQYINFKNALEVASINKKIIDSVDFLRFMAWWYSLDESRNNIFDNSSLGVIQQLRGLLSQEESDYIDQQRATWYGGVPLRNFLYHVINCFPRTNTI